MGTVVGKVGRGLAILTEINVRADGTLEADPSNVAVLASAERSIAVDIAVHLMG